MSLKKKLADFNTSLRQLRQDEKEGKRIAQTHFGDYLMKEEEENGERYRVYLSHPANVKEGQSKWTIEYKGKENGFTWKQIAKG
jgi:hypothetical protein